MTSAGALAVAVEGAALAGAAGVVAIVPDDVEPPSHPALVAAAQRSDDDADDAASALAAALGPEALGATAVAYLGCFGASSRPDALAAEIAGVARAARAVLVVEPDPGAAAVMARLCEAGLVPHDHRLVPPDGGRAEHVLRRLTCWGSSAPAMSPPRRRLSVFVSDHQGKSRAIADALARAGQRIEQDPRLADVVLIDHDVPFHGKLPLAEACVAAGGRAFLYPHGADAGLMSNWDGLYPVSPLLSGALVTAPGHAEVARRFGYPLPVHTIGWSLCELAARRRVSPPRRVLMAPTHGPYHGTEYRLDRNREVFERLLGAPVELTVRHLGSVEENGLRRVSGVAFVQGDAPGAPGMIEQIDAADAVVADPGTFANLAVARGATTVMWDSALCLDNEATRGPAHIERYRELIRFPFEVGDADLWETLCAAADDETRVAAWRARFVGEALDPAALLRALRGG